ncbi:hypothetical protein [Terriglobus sp.]|uniref:hypothetical protein n=1 Tax=Terriglobus sp. TaxID=1889013 RepID=UPI003AFFA0FC
MPKIRGLLGLLFFLLAFVGQASHSHLAPPAGQHSIGRTVLSNAAAVSNTEWLHTAGDDSAETCPLCVSMHSAAPASARGVTHAVQVIASATAEPVNVFWDEEIAFAQLSRPPPALSRIS